VPWYHPILSRKYEPGKGQTAGKKSQQYLCTDCIEDPWPVEGKQSKGLLQNYNIFFIISALSAMVHYKI
jgi:hypothetical protein